MSVHDPHRSTQAKFDSAEAAAVYATKHVGRRKDKLEKACIARALAGVPRGSLILDLPCGTGRITTHLASLGYRVVAADHSEHMIARAKQKCLMDLGKDEESLDGVVRFGRQDVMRTTFGDDSFDAVVCNRLLHHYATADTRRLALAELSRICKGPIVVSFFCSFALSALKFRVVNALKGITPTDRVPIPFKAFRADLEAVGLIADEVRPVRFMVSPQTYVKAVKARTSLR